MYICIAMSSINFSFVFFFQLIQRMNMRIVGHKKGVMRQVSYSRLMIIPKLFKFGHALATCVFTPDCSLPIPLTAGGGSNVCYCISRNYNMY